MAGSIFSFHEHFDPYFELVVYLQTDTKIRLERVQKRELLLFGNRILEGGDMYKAHQKFLEDVAGYEKGIGASTLQQHKEWIDTLQCKILNLDGGRELEENVRVIVKEYLKDEILDADGITKGMKYLYSFLKAIEIREKSKIIKDDVLNLFDGYIYDKRFNFNPQYDSFKVYKNYVEEMNKRIRKN